MLALLLMLIGGFLWAGPPPAWYSELRVTEQHEFYSPLEIISKPAGSWEQLFAVSYPGADLSRIKDCLFYRVPTETGLGVLKLKTIAMDRPCDEVKLHQGDRLWPDIKALQFAVTAEQLLVHITYPGYRLERWSFPLVKRTVTAAPTKLMSSAKFRGPKLIFLSSEAAPSHRAELLADGEICHGVNEDCQVVGASRCSDCASGWYEIPNGCLVGPKYCGPQVCGGANQPACRRGMRWQGKSEKFDCRVDSSFAYCAVGLNIQCQGNQAYCR
jgi:hypothetical protein